MAMQALERTLYRSILRLTRELEAPSRRGSLSACPEKYFSRSEGKVVPLPREARSAGDEARAADDAVDHLVFRANGGSEFYNPSSTRSLRAVATAAARDAATYAGRFDAAELGMAAVRHLGKAAAISSSLARRAVAAPSAGVALREATADDALVGSVLLSHPMACLSQPTLHGAVVVLVAAEESNGGASDGEFVMGVVVNKRAGLGLRDAATEHGAALLGDAILDADLYVGGDVATQTLTAVRAPGSAGDGAAAPPWFTHDLAAVREAIERRGLEDYKILCGYCGWSRAQLLNELDRSVWFRACADAPEALALADGPGDALWRGALSALSPAHEDLSKLAHAHGDVIASLGELGAGDCDA